MTYEVAEVVVWLGGVLLAEGGELEGHGHLMMVFDSGRQVKGTALGEGGCRQQGEGRGGGGGSTEGIGTGGEWR